MKLTPNHIDVLIHHHCCGEPHPHCYAPAVREAIEFFIFQGLLCCNPEDPVNVYRTTPRGAAHVKQLCTVPFPQEAWVGADGQVIG